MPKGMELLIILLVLLLLFGATRLPQLGASLGQSIRNFKKGFSADEEPAGGEKKETPLVQGHQGAGESTKSSSGQRQG